MRPSSTCVLVAAALLCWGARASAVDVYLNGVRITGVVGQEIENATVRLDERGNVHITAPHYRVQRIDTVDTGTTSSSSTTTSGTTGGTASRGQTTQATVQRTTTAAATGDAPPPGGGRGLARRYWLVSEVSSPGMVQYRIEVRVNGRLVRSFDDSASLAPVEVTEYLQPGRNAVRVVAEKLTEGGRRSESSRNWMRVVVADGHIEGTSVVVDDPQIIFTRNAAQTDRATQEFTLTAQ